MEKQESAGAPLLITYPGFTMIAQPNCLRHTGSAGSQHSWHSAQGVSVNRSYVKL